MPDEESTPWWLVDSGTPPPPPPPSPPSSPWITRDPTGNPGSGAYDPPSTPLAPPAPKSAPAPRRRGLRGNDAFPAPPASLPPDVPGAPPPSRDDRQPGKRRMPTQRRNTGARLGIILAIIVNGLIAIIGIAYITGREFNLPLGGGGLPFFVPTSTPTGFAKSATISFTRATQTINAPSSTLVVATNGGGDITGKVLSSSLTGVSSAPQNAPFQAASSVVFTYEYFKQLRQ